MANNVSLTNDTGEFLKRNDDYNDGQGWSLPAVLIQGQTIAWETTRGFVRYEGASGVVALRWPAPADWGPILIDTITGYELAGIGSDMTVRKPAPPQPVQRQPAPVTPNQPNTVDQPDPLDQRRRIVASATAELAAWSSAADEDARVPLRQKYLDATTGLDIKQLKAQAASHTNTQTHWCGIFGTWNVEQVRNDKVLWRFGARPQNVLLCQDMDKLHIGDIGHLYDDPAVVATRAAWQQKYSAAAQKYKDLPEPARSQSIAAEAGPAPPAPANHHVLVTELPDATTVKVIQGNSGTAAASPYPSYSLVTPGSLLRRPRGQRVPGSDLDFFYCSAPPPECKSRAAANKNERCPVADGSPCVLPGP